jgi:hypothetical protein
VGRQNVETAGLGDRIELRQQAVEELADTEVFDLVWFSTPFIRAEMLASALHHVWRALRPGGWILLGMLNTTGEPLAVALAHLRSTYWGGQPLVPSEGQALLEERGFDGVQVLPSPPWALAALVVGRRPL